MSQRVSPGPFGPQAPDCPKSVPGPEGPRRHPLGHSVRHPPFSGTLQGYSPAHFGPFARKTPVAGRGVRNPWCTFRPPVNTFRPLVNGGRDRNPKPSPTKPPFPIFSFLFSAFRSLIVRMFRIFRFFVCSFFLQHAKG